MRKLLTTIIAAAAAAALAGCIDDSFTDAPGDMPRFSTDTLRLGECFTGEMSVTHSFVVVNPHSRQLRLSSIALREGGAEAGFRINVDGMAGSRFENVDIRGGDSIYVFVDMIPPVNGSGSPVAARSWIDFTANGTTASMSLTAETRDVTRVDVLLIDADTSLDSGRPWVVADSIVVARGAILTLGSGTRLCFADKARMTVHGTLVASGTPAAPVMLGGTRSGAVAGRIPYDIMPAQWEGLEFTPGSGRSTLVNTVVANTSRGVRADSAAGLHLVNCRLRNSSTTVLAATSTQVDAIGCEIADAPLGVLAIDGGRCTLTHCTVANSYIFAPVSGPLISLSGDDTRLIAANSIIYGAGPFMNPADGRGVSMTTCLVKASGTDDDRWVDIVWGDDPMFAVSTADYVFDYRLMPGSPAIGRGDASLTPAEGATDFYGLARGQRPDLGAYVAGGR